MHLVSVSSLFFVLSFAFAAQAWSADAATQREFDRWRRQQVERYEGFFSHKKLREQQDQVRRRGAKDQSAARQKWMEDYAKARQQFVQQQKAKPDNSAAERAWEKRQEEKARQYLNSQKNYAEKREELRRLEAKDGKEIPPLLELGLPSPQNM